MIRFLPPPPLHAPSFVQGRARRYATARLDGLLHRDGNAAIEHSRRVAARFYDPVLCSIGWLHDVVEDTAVTTDDVRLEFGARIGDAVDALTRGEHESWRSYVRRVLLNQDAVLVKIADIEDNLLRADERMMKNEKMYTDTLRLLRSSLKTHANVPFSFRLS